MVRAAGSGLFMVYVILPLLPPALSSDASKIDEAATTTTTTTTPTSTQSLSKAAEAATATTASDAPTTTTTAPELLQTLNARCRHVFITFNGPGENDPFDPVDETLSADNLLGIRLFSRGLVRVPTQKLPIALRASDVLTTERVLEAIAADIRSETGTASNTPVAVFLHIDELQFGIAALGVARMTNMLRSLVNYMRGPGPSSHRLFVIPLLTGTSVDDLEFLPTSVLAAWLYIPPLGIRAAQRLLFNALPVAQELSALTERVKRAHPSLTLSSKDTRPQEIVRELRKALDVCDFRKSPFAAAEERDAMRDELEKIEMHMNALTRAVNHLLPALGVVPRLLEVVVKRLMESSLKSDTLESDVQSLVLGDFHYVWESTHMLLEGAFKTAMGSLQKAKGATWIHSFLFVLLQDVSVSWSAPEVREFASRGIVMLRPDAPSALQRSGSVSFAQVTKTRDKQSNAQVEITPADSDSKLRLFLPHVLFKVAVTAAEKQPTSEFERDTLQLLGNILSFPPPVSPDAASSFGLQAFEVAVGTLLTVRMRIFSQLGGMYVCAYCSVCLASLHMFIHFGRVRLDVVPTFARSAGAG